MKNLKVAHKLIFGFSIVSFVALIVGCVGVVGLLTLDENEDTLYREGVESLTGVNGMYSVIVEQRLELRGIIININDNEAANKNVELLRAREEEFEDLYQLYLSASSGKDAKENALIERAMGVYNGQFTTLKEQMIAALKAGDKVALRKAFEQTAQVSEEATNALYEMVTHANDRAAMMNEQDSRTALLLIGISAALTVLLVALSIILGLYISGMISKPLVTIAGFLAKASATGNLALRPEDEKNIEGLSKIKDEIGLLSNSLHGFLSRISDINGALEAVASGDLTTELALLSDADTMGIALQKMTTNLNSMFMEINASTVQVSTGSKQIADGAQSLAQGSAEQASSIEELSASISEIAEQTKQNANIAKEAADLSNTIRDNAEKGNAQMEQMMQAVREINDASSQIGKVIKVIDDIAFQTNILALNAAVEAARAGQHGKGFAVVAEEVRNLAAKSADAAKDTGGLIENSIEKASYGLNIATETSASLKEIVEGINHNANIVAQIAQSSDGQAGAIAQINIGIDQVAQVVQQNSATAEESAAASEEMSGQSGMLERLLSQFKLKDANYSPSSSLLSESHQKILTMPRKSAFALIKNDGGEYGKY